MMKVLLALLGLSPGVATGTYYVLTRDHNVPIDRLVTLTTLHQQVGDCEREIERELQAWRDEWGACVEYNGVATLPEPPDQPSLLRDYRASLQEKMTGACRLRIPYEELNVPSSVTALREAMTALVRDVYRDDEVYLCVAGGRKSMSAIAAIAAQLYGESVKGMYHLTVAEDIEKDGAIDVLPYLSPERRRRVMRPAPYEAQLVDLPFFQFTIHDGQVGLALRGQLQEHIIDYLADYPELVTVLEPDARGQVLGYVYEAQVASALYRQGYFATPHYAVGEGDVDVIATRKGTEQVDEYSRYETGLIELFNRLARRERMEDINAELSRLMPAHVKPAKLRQIVERYFNDDELRTLCFDLSVDYDGLGGESKTGKARELVSFMERRGGIPDLMRAAFLERPNAEWWESPEQNQANWSTAQAILAYKMASHADDVYVYGQRLKEHIDKARLYGDTETRQAERAEIVHRLNALAQRALGVPYHALCGPEQVIVCECKFFEEPGHTLLAEKVRQALKYQELVQGARPRSRVEAWVATNAEAAEDAAWDLAEKHHVAIMSTGKLPNNAVRRLNNGRGIALLRANWIPGDIRPLARA